MLASPQSLDQLAQSGYALLHGVFRPQEIESLADRLSSSLRNQAEPSLLRSRGKLYGSRNLLGIFPEVLEIPRHPFLKEFVAIALGQNAGMVRALYFDKPPDLSWSLPWHRDRTIAVKSNDVPSSRFCKPTLKAGIPHVEAPESLLASMLTLRVHLDPMTAENGPLSVIPGSHLVDRKTDQQPIEISADAGDVLAMRPLLSHSSRSSLEGTTLHRRILHLEFASCEELPDGYEWYSYNPIS